MPNPFLDEYEDETDQPSAENQNFKQLRDYAKKLEKQVSSASKELESLRQFQADVQTERRTQTVASIFKKVGLSEKHAGLFVKINDGDVTEEAVIQFAQEYELPRTEVSETPEVGTPSIETGQISEITQVEAGQAPKVQGFAPAQSSQGPAGSLITSADEAIKLLTENPTEYARLHAAGRIKLDKLPGSGEARLPGT